MSNTPGVVIDVLTVLAVFGREIGMFLYIVLRVMLVRIPLFIGLAVRDLAWEIRYTNDPVLYIAFPPGPPDELTYGRIRRRHGDVITVSIDYVMEGWPPYDGSLAERLTYLKLADEDLTWCRGHEGENADAFRALVTMT